LSNFVDLCLGVLVGGIKTEVDELANSIFSYGPLGSTYILYFSFSLVDMERTFLANLRAMFFIKFHLNAVEFCQSLGAPAWHLELATVAYFVDY